MKVSGDHGVVDLKLIELLIDLIIDVWISNGMKVTAATNTIIADATTTRQWHVIIVEGSAVRLSYIVIRPRRRG